MNYFQQAHPLISPDDTWTLWAIILLGVALSIYLEQTYRWAAKLSGPVLALLAAIVLSNLKITPTESPVYDSIQGYLVPVAIPLLLFRANVVRIIRTTGSMFLAFHVATVGTFLGAFLAAVLFRGRIEKIPEISGIMAASYIGGAVNFFAVKESFQVSGNLTSPLLVADNFIMAGMFILLLLVPNLPFFRRHFPHPHTLDAVDSRALAAEHWKAKEISLRDIASALGIAVVVAAVSIKLTGLIQKAPLSPLAASMIGNPYVLITFFSVLVATVFSRQVERVAGAEELGAYLLYVFFFVIGLPADLVTVLTRVPLMFVFCLVIAATNLVFTLLAGKLLGLDLEELLLAVNATLGGAPSAAATAVSKGWSRLVLPGLLAGVWGYVIGTFCGILVGQVLMRWL